MIQAKKKFPKLSFGRIRGCVYTTDWNKESALINTSLWQNNTQHQDECIDLGGVSSMNLLVDLASYTHTVWKTGELTAKILKYKQKY